MVLLTVKSEFAQHIVVNALALTSWFVRTVVWTRDVSFLDEFRFRV